MVKPPLLPSEALERVKRLARMDGVMILLLAGGYAAMAALAKHGTGLTIGIFATAAGAIELHGLELLNRGASKGLRWVAASQAYLLTVVLCYAAWRLWLMDLEPLRQAMTAETRAALMEVGWEEEAFLRLTHRIAYGVFIVLSVGYQGGMMWYYLSRRHLVRMALGEES